MPKDLWSFATLDAADKSNYLSTAKQGKLQMSQNKNIEMQCPDARFQNPSTFLPWGTQGKEVSANEFKTKLESRAADAWYLRKRNNNLYQIWLLETKQITTVRVNDFKFIIPSEQRQKVPTTIFW